jgi:hypothetical protein
MAWGGPVRDGRGVELTFLAAVVTVTVGSPPMVPR